MSLISDHRNLYRLNWDPDDFTLVGGTSGGFAGGPGLVIDELEGELTSYQDDATGSSQLPPQAVIVSEGKDLSDSGNHGGDGQLRSMTSQIQTDPHPSIAEEIYDAEFGASKPTFSWDSGKKPLTEAVSDEPPPPPPTVQEDPKVEPDLKRVPASVHPLQGPPPVVAPRRLASGPYHYIIKGAATQPPHTTYSSHWFNGCCTIQ